MEGWRERGASKLIGSAISHTLHPGSAVMLLVDRTLRGQMSRDEIVSVVEAYLNGLAKKDLSSVPFAADITFEGPARTETCRTSERCRISDEHTATPQGHTNQTTPRRGRIHRHHVRHGNNPWNG